MDNLSQKQKEQLELYYIKVVPTIKEVIEWKSENLFEDMLKKHRELISFITLSTNK